MDESKHDQAPIGRTGDIRHLIQEAVREFVSLEQAKSEPAYKIELEEERRRREALERKMNELVGKIAAAESLPRRLSAAQRFVRNCNASGCKNWTSPSGR